MNSSSVNSLIALETFVLNIERLAIQMVLNLLVSFRMEDKAKEHIVFLIKMYLWAFGKRINFMETEFIFIHQVKDIKGNFLKEENKEEEFIITILEQFMKDNGKKIERLVLEFILIQMDKNIKVIG